MQVYSNLLLKPSLHFHMLVVFILVLFWIIIKYGFSVIYLPPWHFSDSGKVATNAKGVLRKFWNIFFLET